MKSTTFLEVFLEVCQTVANRRLGRQLPLWGPRLVELLARMLVPHSSSDFAPLNIQRLPSDNTIQTRTVTENLASPSCR